MKAVKMVIRPSITCILAIISIQALAYPSPPSGWYIQGNVGTTDLSNTQYGTGTSTSTNNSGVGLNADLGYQFFPYFALEAGYTRYSRINIQFNNTTVAKNDPSAWDITTKVILPIQDSGFNFYANVGVARLTSNLIINNQTIINEHALSVRSGNQSATGILYGLGGEYYFWGNTAVHASWVQVSGNNQTGNIALISLGLSYLLG